LKFGWIGEFMAASCAAGALIIYAAVIIATSVSITLSLIAGDTISTRNQWNKAGPNSKQGDFGRTIRAPLESARDRIMIVALVSKYDSPAELGESRRYHRNWR
jgi:hypothetical protein